ncbi:MAG: glycosyltransferase [Thermoleophilia bacterium]|nr:glycosyltransferase [Thermoleophilia bacterium]
MRVLVACGWPRPVGAATHAERLTAALRARGLEVQAVAVGNADRPAAHPELGLPPTAVSSATSLEIALGDGVDIGHAEDPSAAVALIALRDAGTVGAVAHTVHHLEAHSEVEPEELERRAIQESDVVVCASNWWADRIRSEFGVEALVVPHGVEAGRFAACAADREAAGAAMGWGARPVVLTVAGVQARKGSRVLLEAFARARARLGDRALLVLAGPVEESDYRDAWLDDADRLGLRVHMGERPPEDAEVVELGTVPVEHMPLLYRAADVVATPSTREGFGLTVLEAAAAGVPNVVSDIPVFGEHLSDGESCLMVPVGDSGPLAMALIRAARDDALRGRLVAGGAEVARRLSWTACAAAHERSYRAVLALR